MDFLFFGILLAALNFFTVGLRDWGWMEVNPSPWMLLPLFIGARHGFGWGVIAGLSAAALILAGRMFHTIGHEESKALLPLLTDNLYFYLSLPGAGFLAGETQGVLSRRLRASEKSLAEVTESQRQTDLDLDVAQEARHQLQERLALLGAEQSNLDKQLRSLFEPGAGPVLPNVLRLLRDIGGLTDAAIYAVDGRHRLIRQASLGAAGPFPEHLDAGEVEIARLAVERGSLTTVKDLWHDAPRQAGPYVAALPWMGANGVVAILLIHRMHFLSATWRNFNRMQMVCQWVAHFLELNAQAAAQPVRLADNASALIVPGAALEGVVSRGLATHRDWQLPSTLAVFEFTEAVPEHVARLLPKAVGAVMRPTDVGSFDEQQERPRFRVFMPMEPRREAEELLNKALGAIARIPQLSGKIVANLSLTDPQGVRRESPAIAPAAA